MKKLTLLFILIAFSAMSFATESDGSGGKAYMGCFKTESDGSGGKTESDGSGNKTESDGSGGKTESDGSGNKSCNMGFFDRLLESLKF